MSQKEIFQKSEDQIQAELLAKTRQKERVALMLPYMGLVLLTALFTALTGGRFLTGDNLATLLDQCFVMVVVIIGGAFLYAIGGLDMAIGTVMALSAMVFTLLLNAGISFVVAMLAALALSIAFMSVTALTRNYLRVTPFIASMCVMNVCQGIVLTVTGKLGRIVFPFSRYTWLNSTAVKIVFLIVLITAGYILFNFTSFGKSLKAVGGNPQVAKISGIKVRKVVWLAYVVVSITMTLGAIFSLPRVGQADISVGSGMNLNIMTAIVLGGFPLTGGANARFSAPIVGALTVSVLTNGLGMMGESSYMGYAVKGVLFLVVVALTYEKSKGKLIS